MLNDAWVEERVALPAPEPGEEFLLDRRAWCYRLALAIVGDPELAEDAAQEALIRAWRFRWARRKAAGELAWYRRIVVRCALNALKRRPMWQELAEEPSQEGAFDEALAVRQVLHELEPMHRAVLALAIYERLSYDEIAQAMNVPVGTVGSRLHAAKAAFKKHWEVE